jgi:hypothetical protein
VERGSPSFAFNRRHFFDGFQKLVEDDRLAIRKKLVKRTGLLSSESGNLGCTFSAKVFYALERAGCILVASSFCRFSLPHPHGRTRVPVANAPGRFNAYKRSPGPSSRSTRRVVSLRRETLSAHRVERVGGGVGAAVCGDSCGRGDEPTVR